MMDAVRTFLQESAYFGLVISLIGYELGLFLKRKLKWAICNPLLLSVIFVMAFVALTGVSVKSYQSSASLLSYLLTPATVCLAVPLYEQFSLLQKHVRAVLAGIVSGVIASLACILLMSWAFSLPHELYVTLLPKSITTANGMGVSGELGGITTITVAVIIITGILGNVIAETVLRLFRITDPIAKGLAMGTSAHAIGTAKAMEMGRIEGAMSSLAIAVCGLLTVIASPLFAGLY